MTFEINKLENSKIQDAIKNIDFSKLTFNSNFEYYTLSIIKFIKTNLLEFKSN